jgi:hypothetical protein
MSWLWVGSVEKLGSKGVGKQFLILQVVTPGRCNVVLDLWFRYILR